MDNKHFLRYKVYRNLNQDEDKVKVLPSGIA